MKTFSIRLSVLVLFAIVTAVSLSPALAAGDDNPAPPAKGKKHDKSSRIDNPKFLAGYRKLGDYRLHQLWHERALKADPNHVKTWQYYGLWQLEQGNRDQAQYHLNKIARLAGTGSAEYRWLAAAMEMPPGTGLVY